MKKIAILLIIAMCFTLCGCPAAEPTPPAPEMLDVHINAGKIEAGMTVKDILVEVTIDHQPVACRLELTGFTSDGYYVMAEDEAVPDPFLVRLDVYYSLPEGKDVDDIEVVMDCDGGEYDGTGSVSFDDDGCVEAWSHAFYGEIPEQTQPTETPEATEPAPTEEPKPTPTETPQPTPTEAPKTVEPTKKPSVHVHNWVKNTAGPILCTTDSVITYSCTCGQGKQEIIPAPGHDMQNKGTTQPTCTEKGRQTMRCSRCSYAIVIEIPATGHTWSDWEKDTGRVHKHTCATCGEVETANHNIPSGDVICTDCGAAIIN